MSDTKPTPSLFAGFVPADLQTWIEKATIDLKGKPLEKLDWTTESGLRMKPLYRPAQKPEWVQVPGEFPFRRGVQSETGKNAWQIVQEISVDGESPVSRIRESREAGVYAFKLMPHSRSLASADGYREAFQALNCEADALHLFGNAVENRSLLQELAESTGEKAKSNPLTGCYFHADTLNPGLDGVSDRQADIIARYASVFPNMKLLGIDIGQLAESGASPVQQLAYALSLTADWVAALAERGVAAPQTLGQIAFSFSLGSSFFPEVAKLRAFRILYAQFLEAYGVEPNLYMPFVLAGGMEWNQTRYDKHSNLLRATTEAIASAVGGAQGIAVPAFDRVEIPESAASARLARNIQFLLCHESYLDEVLDPGGGSYYLETLTDQQVEGAWKRFQQIEATGGFAASYDTISQEILDAEMSRQKAIARQKKVLVGINKYPDTTEVKPPAELAFGAGDLFQPIGGERTRAADRFERLREQVDQMGVQRGKRLTAFLFLYGDVRMRNARALFSRNLMGAGGFQLLENSRPANLEQSLAEVVDASPDTIVLCSADGDYEQNAAQHIAALREALPGVRLLLAGKSSATESLPVDGFLYAGMDVIEFLESFLPVLISRS